jgi:hypothetical protein
LVALIAWFLPLLEHLGSSVLGGPADGTSGIRDYWAASYEHSTPFTLKVDHLIGAPEGKELAPAVNIANAIQPALVWGLRGPLGLISTWNLYLLVAVLLSAFTTFVLLDRIGLAGLPALFGGYVFGFSPYLFAKANSGHGGLVQAWIFPVTVILLLRLHEVPTYRRAAAVGFAVAVAFYLHSYYGLMDTVMLVVFVAVEIARARDFRNALWRFTLFDVSLGVTLLLLIPAFVALVVDRSTVAQVSGHRVDSLQQFGSKPLAFLAPSSSNPVFGGMLSQTQRDVLSATGEPQLFFGWTTIMLAVVAVVLLRRRHEVFRGRRYVALAAAVLIPVAYVMSLPRIVHLGPVSLPAPSYFIGSFTTFWRVYARFGVLVGLGLVVLAAFSLRALMDRGRAGVALAVALAVFAGIELASPPRAWRTNRPPAYDEWLADHPGGSVAFYPPYGGQANGSGGPLFTQEYFFQQVHRHPLFENGSTVKSRSWAIRALTGYLDQPSTPGILAAEHVRYIVVVDSAYRADGVKPVIPSASYRQVAESDGARIFTIKAPAVDLTEALRDGGTTIAGAMGYEPPAATYAGGGYSQPALQPDGKEWRWLRQDGEISVESNAETPVRLDLLAASATVPRTLTLTDARRHTLGTASVGTEQSEIVLGPFTIPKGTSHLFLHAAPGPTRLSAKDPRLGSIFLSPVALQPYVDGNTLPAIPPSSS